MSCSTNQRPEDRLPYFYLVQSNKQQMAVAYHDHLLEGSETFDSIFNLRDARRYRDFVRNLLLDKFGKIARNAEILPSQVENAGEISYSGAITFFSTNPHLQPSDAHRVTSTETNDIRVFLDWPNVCLESDPFRHLSRGLETLLCQKAQCHFSARCPNSEKPDPDCLQKAVGSFLHTLDYSVSNLVDRILPHKEGFHFSLQSMPADDGRIIEALSELRTSLLNKKKFRKEDRHIVERDQLLDWDQIIQTLRTVATTRWRKEVDVAESFLQDLYEQFKNLPLIRNPENMRWLQTLRGEHRYSIARFLELPISLLIVPAARYFYFMHMGLGPPGPDSQCTANHTLHRTPSATLVLFWHAPEPLSDTQLCLLDALMSQIVSSLSMIEHASTRAELEVDRLRVVSLENAVRNCAHNLHHRLKPIVEYFDGADNLEAARGSRGDTIQ